MKNIQLLLGKKKANLLLVINTTLKEIIMIIKSMLAAMLLISALPTSAASSVWRVYELPMWVGCHAAEYHFKKEFPNATNLTCVVVSGSGSMGNYGFKVTGTI
ncbi:hypothetical protein CWB96_18705 [Pseudoalteromonas citrea]|uniref:Uncharacterized protein n=2 Tax=Pseudoalteromonas TaxID=53246 RepID=A0A5S3XJW6_9GAMM|nr:hypothetical protein CWB97_02780 [Pseudoalteromonas citrea]TMP54750.1 hypothetical protein CWB96_18705 [Pseudoalteromonas citrea]